MTNCAIIIDTNQFGKPYEYDFKNGICTKMAKHFKDINNIDVFIPDIVLDEVKSHVKENIKNSYNKMEPGYLKKHISRKMINPIIESYMKEIDDFVANNKIKVINCSKIGILDEICKWYFDRKMPFEDRKKNEFPDAIIVSGIKCYFNENKYDEIFVASEDKGLLKSIEENIDNVKTGTVSDALKEYMNISIKDYNILEQYVKNNLELDDLVFESNDDTDILDISCIQETINDVTIVDNLDNGYEVCVNVNLCIDGEFTIIDPYLSYYDKEDPEASVYFCKTGETIIVDDYNVFISVDLDGNKKPCNIEYDLIELDIYDYIDQMEDVQL